MDALENTLQTQYATEADATTLQRSINFGREVASRVFAWAATDGSANSNPAYIPPVGPGLWVPTATTPPVNPYAIQRRLLVPVRKSRGEQDGRISVFFEQKLPVLLFYRYQFNPKYPNHSC